MQVCVVGYLLEADVSSSYLSPVAVHLHFHAATVASAQVVQKLSYYCVSRELIALGILSEDNSNQWKLNRCGAYFEINTAWKQGGGVIHRETQSEPTPAQATGLAVDNSAEDMAQNSNKKPSFAPLKAKNSPKFAPPYKDLLTSYRTKNQKLENQISGFCEKGREKSNLKNITREDLTRTSRVLELYAQAVKANWLKDSEQNRLRFIAAAIRAKKVGFEPVKVLVAIVRRGLWHHITQQEEDQARAALRKHAERRVEQNFTTSDERLKLLITQAV